MTINYYQKDVYGKKTRYIIDETGIVQRQLFILTGKKTLTDDTLVVLKARGIGCIKILEPEKDELCKCGASELPTIHKKMDCKNPF